MNLFSSSWYVNILLYIEIYQNNMQTHFMLWQLEFGVLEYLVFLLSYKFLSMIQQILIGCETITSVCTFVTSQYMCILYNYYLSACYFYHGTRLFDSFEKMYSTYTIAIQRLVLLNMLNTFVTVHLSMIINTRYKRISFLIRKTWNKFLHFI